MGDAPAAGDLRTRTSLFCGALALAIAVSILLRQRPGRRQWLFAAFAADIGLWYLAQWLYHFMRADVWVRFTAVLAALLPQFALHLFDSLMPAQKG
ncbi:MAG TPA: two-component system sensor protein, partial [Polyangiaceae bacterium]